MILQFEIVVWDTEWQSVVYPELRYVVRRSDGRYVALVYEGLMRTSDPVVLGAFGTGVLAQDACRQQFAKRAS